MPELPEVEVTRRSFAGAIEGATVRGITVGKPLRWPLGMEPAVLVGRRVCGVRRRGKYLLLDLDEGLLLIHLGMSGSLRFARDLPARGAHDHFELITDQGTLRLHDPRRFGAVVWAAGESDPRARKLLDGWGLEPLGEDFAFESFHAGLRAKRSPIKQLLLAGTVVVGVGNIYACEVL
ncbi:MAG: DNA-formamidopyrimidine glycosylase family protein, partial [Acidovorax sp.]|nr:DNA-formamidopyrimidine glycosylase family protein [Acidovorax sp.]